MLPDEPSAQSRLLRDRIRSGASWSLVGALVAKAMGVIGAIVVARVLGREGFGELAIIQSTVLLFGIFAGLALGTTATKYVSEYRTTDRERAGRIVALSGVLSIGLSAAVSIVYLLVASALADGPLSAPHLVGPLRIAAGLLFLRAINGPQVGALLGFEAFRGVAGSNLFTGLVGLPLSIAGVLWDGLDGLLWAQIVQMALVWLYNHLLLRSVMRDAGVRFQFRGSGAELDVLWRFSLPSVIGGAMVAPVEWVCRTIIANMPGGYGQLGLYNAAYQYRQAVQFVPMSVMSSSLPILSNLDGEKRFSEFGSYLKWLVKVGAIAGLAIGAPLALAAPLIMKLYGPAYAEAAIILVVLVVATALEAVELPLGKALAAKGLIWQTLVMKVGWGAVLLTTTYLLADLGGLGLALAVLASFVCHGLWLVPYTVYAHRRDIARFGPTPATPPES